MAVPDTSTVILSDVINEIGLSYPASLLNCFSNAIDAGFDPAYEGNKDRLTNFRNYSHLLNWLEHLYDYSNNPAINTGNSSLSSEITTSVSGTILSAPALNGAYVYPTTSSGYVYKIDMSNMSVIGSINLTTAINGSALYDSGFIYVAGEGGVIYKIDDSTFSTVDTYNTGGVLNGTPIIDGDYIYVVTESGRVFKITKSSMSNAGQVDLYGQGIIVVSSPSIDISRNYLFIGTGKSEVGTATIGGYIYKVDLSSLAVTRHSGNGSYDNKLFVTNYYIYAVMNEGYYDPRIGYFYNSLIEKIQISDLAIQNNVNISSYLTFSSPSADERYIYVASKDGYVYKFEQGDLGQNLTLIDSYSIGNTFESTPIILGDYIYIGEAGTGLNIELYKYDMSANSTTTYNIGSQMYASPVLYGDAVYLGVGSLYKIT